MKAYLPKTIKSPWLPISLIILVIIFFSVRLIITYDSAHYLNYVSILEGSSPASSWDIVRGPIFPILIYTFGVLFGKTSAGFLIGAFIFYLIFTVTCYKTCKYICQQFKHKILIQNITLAVLILNPLIMGYFHVLLTEFVAITFTMLNILIAFKWLFFNTNNKKHAFLYSLYFIFSIIFCYHLKQPYIIISFVPPLIAAIITIIKNNNIKNIMYRVGTIMASIIFLFTSVVCWNKILESIGTNMDTGRDSSSLLSQQLLNASQITYDKDNDGKTDPISTFDAIGIIANTFINDPVHIITIYMSNYCSLSSLCAIESNDSVNYKPTFYFTGTELFENSTIGYKPYTDSSNIFEMPEQLYNNAIIYGESSERSFFARAMNKLILPTNLLFKSSITLCLPALIFIIVLKIKTKDKRHLPIFYLSLILITTSFTHLAISAGLGLIIDRYAIEIFVPSLLGIFSSFSYFYSLKQNKAGKNKKNRKQKAISS